MGWLLLKLALCVQSGQKDIMHVCDRGGLALCSSRILYLFKTLLISRFGVRVCFLLFPASGNFAERFSMN